MRMKSWKNTYTCIVIVVYVILLSLFFSLEKDQLARYYDEKLENCSYKNTCFSLCEESSNDKFTVDFIKENFPSEDFPKLKQDNDKNVSFTIIKHKLDCKTYEKMITVSNSSKFTLYRGGEVEHHQNYMNELEYCFQPYEQADKLKFELKYCEINNLSLKIFHYILLIFTAIFLIAPTAIYISFNEIQQTLNGKLCIALTLTQIYLVFIMPLEELDLFFYYDFAIFFFFFGSFSTNFVVNLMCFDIYLTLKHFREPHYQSTYFKNFVIFLLIFFLSVTIVVSILKPFYADIYAAILMAAVITFLLTLFMNIFALISAFYHLISLIRSTTLSENTRFDIERERFWLYMKLFAIMTVTWFVEMKLGMMWDSHDSKIVADVIKCFSAGLSAFLLLTTSTVYSLVFEKYGTIKNEENPDA